MKIVMAPGDKLVIAFKDSDGRFEVHFDSKEHKNAIVVKETGGMSGNIVGAAFEVMHEERFGKEYTAPTAEQSLLSTGKKKVR